MQSSVEALAHLMRGRPTLVLSGAGISTESGIPDYRGPNGSMRTRRPMQYREFVGSEDARRRYWARSAIGWIRVGTALPNAGHAAIARLEQIGAVTGVITQNVDGLHQAAGSIRVLELHGSLAEVRCLSCGLLEMRDHLQARLVQENPAWASSAAEAAPDGDAEVSAETVASFSVPGCLRCGGVLKPDVVFFGESVPRSRVEAAWGMLAGAEVLLVVGSSLAIFSGLRFVSQAARENKPVAIVNQGETRGDGMAAVRIEGRLGDVLPSLVAALEG
jgi:NAD-dependent SIR2 family protein deacetylase